MDAVIGRPAEPDDAAPEGTETVVEVWTDPSGLSTSSPTPGGQFWISYFDVNENLLGTLTGDVPS